MWWNFKSLTSHIYFLINIKTGDDEEDPRPPGSPSQQPAQPEDDGPLVLLEQWRISDLIILSPPHLNHFDHREEGEGESGGQQED